MAAAWGQVCRQCVNTVVEIPVQILLIAAIASLLGLFVLVSSHSPAPLVPDLAVALPTHVAPIAIY
jgi:hypothetical protein